MTVHTFENWLDTGKAILLDWSETFVGEHVFGIAPNDSVFELLRQVLNVCNRASKPDSKLVCDAARLRAFNEHAKQQKAQLFAHAVTALRSKLADPSLTFITADGGFGCVTHSAQAASIRVAEANDVRNPTHAPGFLTGQLQ